MARVWLGEDAAAVAAMAYPYQHGFGASQAAAPSRTRLGFGRVSAMALNDFGERELKVIVQREVEHGSPVSRHVRQAGTAGTGESDAQYNRLSPGKILEKMVAQHDSNVRPPGS